MRKSIFFTVFILFSMLAAAQPELSGIQFDNKVYVKGVTSVTLLPTNQIHGEPVMQLGKGYGQLSLTFDDLDEVDRYYKYTLIHCTHDWKPSDMNPIEYLDGFMEDELEVYNYSFNTITHYVQHQLVFPTQNMQITRSGNYLLLVYDDTPDQPVLTRRFMVLESDPVGIDCQVHAASDVNDRFTKQEIDFSMTTGSYLIRNPAMTVHATIKQNGRWDNAIYGLTYRSGYPGVLSFDYDDGRNVMPGGAEFRTFDISTLHSNADRIVGITYANHENHAYVLQDDAWKRTPDPENIPETINVMGLTIGKIYNADAMSFDIYDHMPNYTGNVLIIHGTADEIVPLGYSERAARTFPSARLVTIKGGGHGFDEADAYTAADLAVRFVRENLYKAPV